MGREGGKDGVRSGGEANRRNIGPNHLPLFFFHFHARPVSAFKATVFLRESPWASFFFFSFWLRRFKIHRVRSISHTCPVVRLGCLLTQKLR